MTAIHRFGWMKYEIRLRLTCFVSCKHVAVDDNDAGVDLDEGGDGMLIFFIISHYLLTHICEKR